VENSINKVISDVILCAEIFDKELNNRNLLFVVQNEKRIDFIETCFEAERFQHLTGLTYKNKTGEVDSLAFYELCVDKSINQTDLYIKKSKSVREIGDKLSALRETAALHKTARMVGDYNNNGIALKTDKFAGSVSACIGFIPIGKFYVPNTNIKVDIRDKINYPMPILATLRKNIGDEKYTEITHVKKGLDFSTVTLPEEILAKLSDEAKTALKQPLPALEKDTASPVAEDFTVTRHIGGTFTVSLGDMTRDYELLRGAEKEAEVAKTISEDFGCAFEVGEDLFNRAAEQNAVEQKAGEAQDAPEPQALIKDEKETEIST